MYREYYRLYPENINFSERACIRGIICYIAKINIGKWAVTDSLTSQFNFYNNFDFFIKSAIINIEVNKMEKFPLTKQGFIELEAELKHLKAVERPNIIAAIAEARSHGDLSENAEYSAAKEKQSFIEGRIQDLEAVISRAQVIDPATSKCGVIRFGATVLVADEDTDKEQKYQIVGDYEADIDRNKISLSSPLAKALIGKEVGDVAEFSAPGGKKSFEIIEIDYI